MAYIPRRLEESKLKEHLSSEAFDLVMAYFKEHPRKTTLKIKDDAGKVVIRKYEGKRGHYLYTLSVL